MYSWACKPKWLQWKGMQTKVPKCHSLGIHASSGTSLTPASHSMSSLFPSLEPEQPSFLVVPSRYLWITPPSEGSCWANYLECSKELTKHQWQDNRSYAFVEQPRLNWDLTVNNVPLSWITGTMEATATWYLKRWSGLARSVDPSRLYLPQSKGGLHLPSISLLYKKQQVSQACQLLVSADPTVRHTTIRREEALQRATHRPMLVADCWKPWQQQEGIGDQSKGSSDRRWCQREATTCPVTWVPKSGHEVYRGRCSQDLVQDSPEAPTWSPQVLSKRSPRHFTSQRQSGQMEEDGKPFQCLLTFWREANTPTRSRPLPPSPEHAPLQHKTWCCLGGYSQLHSSTPPWGLQSYSRSSQIPTLCVSPPHCYNWPKTRHCHVEWYGARGLGHWVNCVFWDGIWSGSHWIWVAHNFKRPVALSTEYQQFVSVLLSVY